MNPGQEQSPIAMAGVGKKSTLNLIPSCAQRYNFLFRQSPYLPISPSPYLPISLSPYLPIQPIYSL
ncbi:MAG: hypothetical protein F6J99_01500 [Moorea sp. SIO4G3]|nr:hypothetical protein [Moorena sp. SIO4G3]